jgi:hypothetical protein
MRVPMRSLAVWGAVALGVLVVLTGSGSSREGRAAAAGARLRRCRSPFPRRRDHRHEIAVGLQRRQQLVLIAPREGRRAGVRLLLCKQVAVRIIRVRLRLVAGLTSAPRSAVATHASRRLR